MAQKQLIFIDESGDSGFKKASSTHFVVAAVCFYDTVVAENVSATMARFKKQIGWSEDREYKFTKTKKRHVKALLEKIAAYDYTIYAIIVNKRTVQKIPSGNFHSEVVERLLAKIPMEEATIKLDGSSGTNHMKSVETFFRKATNVKGRKVKRISFADSKKNLLVQLADLVAGAMLRYAQANKTDYLDYYKILKCHLKAVYRYK